MLNLPCALHAFCGLWNIPQKKVTQMLVLMYICSVGFPNEVVVPLLWQQDHLVWQRVALKQNSISSVTFSSLMVVCLK